MVFQRSCGTIGRLWRCSSPTTICAGCAAEIWGYVGKKQRRTGPSETDKGDQYTFTALGATSKAIISFITGKRTEATTRAFVNDVWERMINRPQITTDGYGPYIEAVAECFGDGADFAQLVKHYAADHSVE